MLRECLKIERVYWAWSGEQWIVVLGRGALEFRARQRPRVCQGVRVEIAAVAYLYGWFRDVMALGGFKRFGSVANLTKACGGRAERGFAS